MNILKTKTPPELHLFLLSDKADEHKNKRFNAVFLEFRIYPRIRARFKLHF